MSIFRGIKGIREAKARFIELAEWYERFKPDVKVLTVDRSDYDLIARWPKAAHVEDISVTDNGIFWRGFQLAYDSGQGRYLKPETPVQEVIQ